ncbi:unnamed protein product [Rhodiola kirilowii]
MDLGYKGLPFTYSNNRVGEFETRARLDRAFSNEEWRMLFPNFEVRHLISTVSDHLPLILDIQKRRGARRMKLFRFEPMWMRHGDFNNLISKCWTEAGGSSTLGDKLNHCRRELTKWNRQSFGKVGCRISTLKKNIEQLKGQFRSPEVIEKEAELCEELEEWLAREELLWRQRSRVEWLNEGDLNTKFFHQRASHRRKKNSIQKIQGDDGEWITEEVSICDKAVRFYESLFKSDSHNESADWVEALSCINNRVSEEAVQNLNTPFTALEVQCAIFQLGSTKAPGLDGFSALFFQKFWEQVKIEVIRFALDFLNNGKLDPLVNQTLITLIPKVKNPEKLAEYRPISLVNVTMKIITKTLANRLKVVLPSLISESQSAFIPGRLITDNILLAHELMHFIKTRSSRVNGYYCVKLDMTKAYDRVDWKFLEEIQLKLGFPVAWVSKVMHCVKTVSYKIRVNDMISEVFYPERGLRQGDPLSPYLFVICTEWLARSLEKHQSDRLLKGVKISPSAPMISNLLFADDSIIFLKADVDNTFRFKSILRRYEELSGQQVNFNKSEMCVGNNIKPDYARALSSILGVRLVNTIEKYLGLPLCFSYNKRALFKFIEERIWRRVHGWKERLLSIAGRETLIKAIVQAIPIYAMSCFKIPVTMCHTLLSIVTNYWWNSAKGKRYVAWVGKKTLCLSKQDGGLGFKKFDLVNEALLVKQVGRLLKCPELLVSKVFKARYFPHTSILYADIGRRPSWAWRSFHGALHTLGDCVSSDSSPAVEEEGNSEDKDISVRRVYSFLMNKDLTAERNNVGEPSDPMKLKQFWQKLWRVKAQGKVKNFMWRLYHNAIPSAINLFRRGCQVDLHCPRCGSYFESTDHIFLKCWWAVDFWKQLLNVKRVMELDFHTLADWVWYCLEVYSRQDLTLIFYGARWIWFARNSMVHKGVFYRVEEAVARVKALVNDYATPTYKFIVSRDEATQVWLAPKQGEFKVNCDGAWCPEGRRAGLAIVGRDHNGLVLFAKALHLGKAHSALEAEGKALLLGMKEAQLRGWSKVTFSSDSAEACLIVMGKAGRCYNEEGWRTDFQKLLNAFTNWNIEHVFREGNMVADVLAVKACKEAWSWSSGEIVPMCISQAVRSDLLLLDKS